MYYELYIDVFFLENFMIDSLLLLAVGRAMKCFRSYGRVVLGGMLGSLLTCLVVAAPLPAAIKLLLFHFSVNSLMITAGLRISGAAQFAKAFVLLYLAAVAAGGAAELLRPWMRYAGLLYGAFAAGYFLFYAIWRTAARSGRREGEILSVTLYAGKTVIETNALWDTGNNLTDPLTGDPVNIVAPGLAKEMLAPEGADKGFRYIPFRCVGGESVLPVFRGEKMCIHTGEDCWIMRPLLGISPSGLSREDGCQMILNPGVLYR